jgi:hypothetical protein
MLTVLSNRHKKDIFDNACLIRAIKKSSENKKPQVRSGVGDKIFTWSYGACGEAEK